MSKSVFAILLCCGLLLETAVNANDAIAVAQADSPAMKDPPGIHNLRMIAPGVYSGSQPEGEEAFQSLSTLGIKTVVSVDGSRPDVESARKHGLRYVHIPIGYNGISRPAQQALAKVSRQLAHPIYVHCHHGRHRGPAAAAVICLAGGLTGKDEALASMRLAGTGREYQGLWRDVHEFEVTVGKDESPELVEVAVVPSIVEGMVAVDGHLEELKQRLKKPVAESEPANDHQPSPGKPADSEIALLLQEGLHEMERQLPADADENFREWMKECEADSAELCRQLSDGRTDAARKQLSSLEQSCRKCHAVFRNQ